MLAFAQFGAKRGNCGKARRHASPYIGAPAADDSHAEPYGVAHPACEQDAMNNGLNPNIGRRDLLRVGPGAGAAFAVKALLARAESASSAQALHSAVHSVSLPTQSYDPFLPDRCAG